ncbi:hypothetical protein I601_0336 [Nocardioides dokdonensis FR1436]|uniref:Uncharacterized protein n=1 Tax=Nocardioides dokdonensis FR1436 TaxID=1300347 RepID=A0A1A9GEN4_9ACTN|nr:hypothetical protein [Nocardioides dokdonensis]ANH36789.1 hypothetical protein I601_0336 [Nocardioides dokdonensis FR1436]
MSATTVDEGLAAAFRHRWRTAGYGSQSRLIGGVGALVGFLVIHTMVFLDVGNLSSLVAIALNPVAGYVLVRGWAYWSIPWLIAGIAFAFAVTAGPFYFL